MIILQKLTIEEAAQREQAGEELFAYIEYHNFDNDDQIFGIINKFPIGATYFRKIEV